MLLIEGSFCKGRRRHTPLNILRKILDRLFKPILFVSTVCLSMCCMLTFSFFSLLFLCASALCASPRSLTTRPERSIFTQRTSHYSRRHASHCFLRAGSGATADGCTARSTKRQRHRSRRRRRPPRSRCTIHHDASRISVVHVAVDRAVGCECGGCEPSRCCRSGCSAILLHRQSAQHR